jgi:hypothetical protein
MTNTILKNTGIRRLPPDAVFLILGKLTEEPTPVALSKFISVNPVAFRLFVDYHKSLLGRTIEIRKKNLNYLLDPVVGANKGWYYKEEFGEVAQVSREIFRWTKYQANWASSLETKQEASTE